MHFSIHVALFARGAMPAQVFTITLLLVEPSIVPTM